MRYSAPHQWLTIYNVKWRNWNVVSVKYNVKTLRPCVGGGFVIEAHFEKKFSMEVLCRLLEGIAQCSEKLGVARFSHEGCTFTLYRSGRIDVRRAESEDEAIRLIDDIKPIVEAAFIIQPLL
jgi:ArsR family metal-binding transcriptional regulator